MRKFVLSLALLAGLSTLAFVPACSSTSSLPTFSFGQQARDRTLMPAVKLAWPGVMQDATRSDPDPVGVEEFGAAIETGDRHAIPYGVWPGIRDAALANIDAQATWSAGVKQSHVERVSKFDEAIRKLQERQ